jgi:hypothetical protein
MKVCSVAIVAAVLGSEALLRGPGLHPTDENLSVGTPV